MKHILVAIISLVILYTDAIAAQKEAISTGYPFPELQLPTPGDQQDIDYLDIPAGEYFSPSMINAQVVLVEFLNTHCPHCKDQAPIYNKLFKKIEKDRSLKSKIKMIGIGVGNAKKEIESFRKNYKIPFPLFSDANFNFWRTVGGKTTPFTVYVRQDQPGKFGVVAGTHSGTNHDIKETLHLLEEITTESVADLLLPEEDWEEIDAIVEIPFTDRQLELKVRTALAKYGSINSFEELSLESSRRVYRARIRQGATQKNVFAEIISRHTVCDICHDVHFLYLFDKDLRIFDVKALQLTKYGNKDWDKQDMKRLKSQLKDRLVTKQQEFNPEIDAITSATITSAVIYDSLNQGQSLVDELQENDLL